MLVLPRICIDTGTLLNLFIHRALAAVLANSHIVLHFFNNTMVSGFFSRHTISKAHHSFINAIRSRLLAATTRPFTGLRLRV